MPKTGTLAKAHLVQDIAQHNGYTYRKSVKIVETLLELIKQTLKSCEDVLISGFGKLIVKQKRERRGRNPSTGEVMMMRPKKVVKFRCSEQLREKVNR